MADYPIGNVSRRVVYSGSAGTGPYAFNFAVLANTDIAVYKNSTLLTLTTDYTVTISSTTGLGSVTLVSAATGSDTITIVGARAIQRSTDFVTGGDFFANTLNTELDSETIFVQQVAETAERSLKAPVTDPTSIDMTLPAKSTRAGKYLSFNATTGNPETSSSVTDVATVAGIAADVTTVAGISANVTTVAGNSSNITTVAGNNSNVTTVAGISSNVTTVAGNTTNINSVASNSTNINTVATNIANVNSVGTNISSVNTAASNISAIIAAPTEASNAAASAILANDWATKTSGTVAGGEYSAKYHASAASTSASNASSSASAAASAQSAAESARDATLAAYDSFDDRYLGAKSTAPTLDNDGNTLIAGTLYFDTVAQSMQLYTGTIWTAAYISGSGYLAAANNLSELTNKATARTNLSLGTLATVSPTGTADSTTFLRGDNTYAVVAVTPTAVSDQANSSTGYFDIPSGTTAQRPGTPNTGMVRYNTTIGYMEVYTSAGWTTLAAPPAISSVSPTDYSGNAGTTITVNGSNFDSSAVVAFGTGGTFTNASATTYVNSTQLTATTPIDYTIAQSPLSVKVTNGSGLSTTKDSALTTGSAPVWTIASGSLGSVSSNSAISFTVTATDSESGGGIASYAVYSGSLPTGASLNGSTGAITGTSASYATDTTSTFTLRVTDNAGNTADRSFSITVLGTNYSADFLVVAGGASAGSSAGGGSGGGGAGGMRYGASSGTSGGGASAESPITIALGTVYTITVGAGGAANTNGIGNDGSNSSISGSGLTTITSTGGGAGSINVNPAHSGGCGGGGPENSPYTAGSGTSGQGYGGGNGQAGQGGGGGGTGAAGATASGGAHGGTGTACPITGTSTYYGGGGGGSRNSNPGGTGGTGGGGNGGPGSGGSGTVTSGTANTGGGGGGTYSSGAGTASGGSGVVILRVLTSKYSGTTTGSPTVTTDGSYKVIKFTASGTYTG